MKRRKEYGVCLTIFMLLMVRVVEAMYEPAPLYVMAGRSDAVVFGEVASVEPKIFTLRIREVLAGAVDAREIKVLRFVDWTCSHRWKPYQAGQIEVAFLYALGENEARETGAKYRLMSAGDEGEWEIEGDQVSVQGFRIPGGRVFDQGEHPGQWLPLADVLDALRTYRRCFSYTRPPAGPGRRQIRQTCSPMELEEYRARSAFHEYLVKTSPGTQQ